MAIVFSISLGLFVSIPKYKYLYDLALVIRPKMYISCVMNNNRIRMIIELYVQLGEFSMSVSIS